MQTFHRPNAPILPCLTGPVSESLGLNLNLGLLHSSLIYHFNPHLPSPPPFLGAKSSSTGKAINLLVHSSDARFYLFACFLLHHQRGVT